MIVEHEGEREVLDAIREFREGLPQVLHFNPEHLGDPGLYILEVGGEGASDISRKMRGLSAISLGPRKYLVRCARENWLLAVCVVQAHESEGDQNRCPTELRKRTGEALGLRGARLSSDLAAACDLPVDMGLVEVTVRGHPPEWEPRTIIDIVTSFAVAARIGNWREPTARLPGGDAFATAPDRLTISASCRDALLRHCKGGLDVVWQNGARRNTIHISAPQMGPNKDDIITIDFPVAELRHLDIGRGPGESVRSRPPDSWETWPEDKKGQHPAKAGGVPGEGGAKS